MYKVSWRTATHAGFLREEFGTFEAADAAGERWLDLEQYQDDINQAGGGHVTECSYQVQEIAAEDDIRKQVKAGRMAREGGHGRRKKTPT